METYRKCISEIKNAEENEIIVADKVAMLCSMFDMITTLIHLSHGENSKLIRCTMVQNFILESVLDTLDTIEVIYRRCHEKTSYVSKAKLCRGTKKLFPMVNLN